MSLDQIPKKLHKRFRFDERKHASAILASDFPKQWQDLLDSLSAFSLPHSWIVAGGGGRSRIPQALDGFLAERGWTEQHFDVDIVVDGNARHTPTHSIDNVNGKVGIEVEWNNKTEFYDRDLNNFRLLHEIDVISVGVIITRVSELQTLFNGISRKIGNKYGASTTHWNKLIPKVDGGGAGGCPLLMVGITEKCYDPNA